MSVIMLSGTVALLTSFVGLVPQIIKSLKTKSTQDISMWMLINFLVCSLAWIIYGCYTDSWFVLASNIVGLVSSLVLIIQKNHYDIKAI